MIVKIIQLLHLILILGVISSVFVPNFQLKKLSFTFLIFILVQYITNYGKCGLTELEYVVMGDKYSSGFIYRLVKPIITVPEKYFDVQLYWIHVGFIVILGYQLNQ
jgi:hypothetical protein